MNLKPEEVEVGRENFYDALSSFDRYGIDRRDFLKAVVGAGVVSGAGLGAMWFGYNTPNRPIRVGVIGTGDEGNVLIGALNPDYTTVTAIADIRPSSIHRAFHGDYASPAAYAARKGLNAVYGWRTESEARKHVKVYEDYKELLKDPDIEAVIIALPLHLHAEATVLALNSGKHVLTEKLMAHSVAECKVMARVAADQGLHLATGHQRHYNILYDNAVNMLRWGVLGQVHYIRAQWHRGNLPGKDSWAQPIPGGEPGTDRSGRGITVNPIADQLNAFKRALGSERDPKKADLLKKKVAQWAAWDHDQTIVPDLDKYGYDMIELKNEDGSVNKFSAMNELIRWRLWERTGGGLMAELGSHQLDAASIFVSALRDGDNAAHPLNVHAVGQRSIFPHDRDSDDHVYCMFEFPGPGYDPRADVGYYDPVMAYPPRDGIEAYPGKEKNKIMMTYSSINGNGFGGYGEIVMGTKGTMVLEREKEVMLYKNSDTSTRVGVKNNSAGPTMDTQASGGGAVAKAAVEAGPVSRGYTEEIEHWAWCIQNPDPENRPKCHPEVAVADAVLALTAKVAMKNVHAGKGGYIKFEPEWFDIDNDATSDGSDVKKTWERLHAT